MTSLQQPSTKEDILRFLLKQGQATAQAISEHLDVSPQAVRRHLKGLEADSLIEHSAVQEGMGRPNYFYMLSRKGRDRFPSQYDQFAVSLLDTLNETVGPETVSSVLRQQWQRKAREYREKLGSGPVAERVKHLVKLRQDEGYMAEWHPVDEAAGAANPLEKPAYVITEYNCAISHIAESYPTVCGHELAMFAQALPDCSVERTHWLVRGEHLCGYLIQEK
ncbi:MAG: iron-sulfur cluster biosynthesis transcriptional regulator SufR [Leptolyngbya sp. SIO4C1]|nr:iron-sulfur cluster biosynthesis transcriptional regulator SufR [Leptolyngbya sp. SIO4C1]